MRSLNSKGIDLVRRSEGLRLTPYKDVAGKPTIGIGHLIRKGEDFSAGITEEEAEAILQRDLISARTSVCTLIKVTLSDNQFAALVDFTFNLGGAHLQSSTLRRKINRGETDVRKEFMRWNKAAGLISIALTKRRRAEADLYLTPDEI